MALVSLAALVSLVALVNLVAPGALVLLVSLVARNLSPCCLRESPEKPIGSDAEPRRWSPWE